MLLSAITSMLAFALVRSPFVAAVLIGTLSLACAGGGAPQSAAADGLRVDRFDADRTWQIIERQLAHGQRPAGSVELRALAPKLRRLLPNGRFEALPSEPGLRKSSIGALPGRRPAIVSRSALRARLRSRSASVGSNNGAAGTAVVIEAARALRRVPPSARGARGALRPPRRGGARGRPAGGEHRLLQDGPTRLARLCGAPPAPYRGDDPLGLRREPRPAAAPRGSSTPALWRRLRAAAQRTGAARYFPDATGPTITDDHTPFLRAGVPAVDLIDWSYPGHDLSDQLDQLSRRSLDAVGETVVELVGELCARRRGAAAARAGGRGTDRSWPPRARAWHAP